MIATTFSGSKGGTGKTTLAVCLSVVVGGVAPTLLVDASSEGGATAYLVGDVPPPYLRDDPSRSLRRVESGSLRLTIAVNRGPLADLQVVADHVQGWSRAYSVVVVDLLVLTDVDAVERYMPLLKLADAVLVVTEPSPAAMEAALYKFSGKSVVVVLNQPRPYPLAVVNQYISMMRVFCRNAGCEYVVVPYEPAMSRLSPSTLRVINYTSEEFDAAIMRLARLLLRQV
ncbi:MAG: hypothetical protein QXS92_02430 [Thermofilum sp.]